MRRRARARLPPASQRSSDVLAPILPAGYGRHSRRLPGVQLARRRRRRTRGAPGCPLAGSGAVHFIDRALASFFAHAAPGFRSQLAEFQADCRARHPDADSFATLTHEQQVDWLRTREQTPLFTQARALTLLGLFSLPEYGGNRGGLGWQLIGFEDARQFATW